MSHYQLHIPDRPWQAIRAGTKKVEGRVYRQTTPYHELKAGDSIEFVNEDTGAQLIVDVKFVHHYPDARSMLESEGVDNVLSSRGTIDEGVESFDNFTSYRENIPKYGIYAIGVSLRQAAADTMKL